MVCSKKIIVLYLCAILSLSYVACDPVEILSLVDIKDNGQFGVAVGGELWLQGNASCTGVNINDVTYSGGPKGLLVPTISNHTGKDKLGSYSAISYHWVKKDGGDTVSKYTIRIYQQGSFLVFEQKFFVEIKNSGQGSLSDPGLNTQFPCFTRNAGKLASLSWFTYNGGQTSSFSIGHGDGLKGYKSNTQGGSPIVLFNDEQVLVFSQLDNIKVGRIQATPHTFQSGILGTIKKIPSGWTQSFIMSAGTGGINAAMMDWGDVLLKHSGKQRTSLYSTTITSTIGFWTDNGGYYHYGGFENKTGGYFEAMKKVHEYHQSIEMPFGHWMLDSWWYLKGDHYYTRSSQDKKYGDYHWIADPFVFPDGVPSLHSLVGVPLQLHNRWFNSNNAYMSLLPKIKWTKSASAKTPAVMPLDPCALYSYFFTQQEGYGLETYEQDFLDVQWNNIPELRKNITLARDWLNCMASAAAAHNLTIQYCMSYPNDHLVASQHPNVVTIRVSRDYEPSGDNWRIGHTSLLAWSLGTLPFKDVFLSSSGIHEEGGAKRASAIEYNSELEALVSILSASIVAPGDGVNYLNKTRLMQTCDKCGNLLKPDRPATMVDVWFQKTYIGGINSSFTTTHSIITSDQKNDTVITYILAANFKELFSLIPIDIGIDDKKDDYIKYDWYSGMVSTFTKTNPITVLPTNNTTKIVRYNYAVVSPISNSNWAFLGQLDKFVTASTRLVVSLGSSTNTLVANLVGHCAQETISVCAVHSSDLSSILCKKATFSHPGQKISITWTH